MAQGRRRKRDAGQAQDAEPTVPASTAADERPTMQIVHQASMTSDCPPETLTVPQHLRRAREKLGLKVEALASELCIKPTFLAALENGHYHELPANAYVIGFLRSYANRLGLNGEAMLDLYRIEMQGRNKGPQLLPPQPIAEGKAPGTPLIVGGLVAALLLYGGWNLISKPQEETPELKAEDSAAIVDQITGTAPADQPATGTVSSVLVVPDTVGKVVADGSKDSLMGITITGDVKVDPLPKAEPAEKPAEKLLEEVVEKSAPVAGTVYGETGDSKYTIKASEDCWVVVQDVGDVVLFSRLLKAGDSVRLPMKDAMKLTTGNAGGVTLWADDRQLASFGKSGQVIKGVNLDEAAKKATKPAKPAAQPKVKKSLPPSQEDEWADF